MSSEDLSLLHTLFSMYSLTVTSRVPSNSYGDREAFSIAMAHLGLLFYLLGYYYNLHLKLMLQDPYDSLGVTYSQEFTVSFRHGILCGSNSSHGILFGSNYSPSGSKFKYEEYHLLSHQCISVVLHGLRIHHAAIPELIEHIPLLPKKNIPPDIFIYFGVYEYFVSMSQSIF